MKRFFLLTAITFSVCLLAQEGKQSSKDIFRQLALADSASGATVKVFQDVRIETSLADRKPARVVQSGSGPGFRIQVFSSNVQRTAKSEAFKIEKEIRDYFPETGVYVSYTSPFWKVRVGDFKTTEEAATFRSELLKAFPQLRNAIYTVKDKINY